MCTSNIYFFSVIRVVSLSAPLPNLKSWIRPCLLFKSLVRPILEYASSVEGYDLFPEKFPIQDTRGILLYIKQDLKAVEVDIDQDFKECVVVKVNPGRFAPKSESIYPT
jgi:hypothetical protein